MSSSYSGMLAFQWASSGKTWKLRGMYYLIQISGLVVLFSLGAVIGAFPDSFAFLRDVRSIVRITFALFALHLMLFIARELSQRKAFFVASRYLWVAYFLACVYLTGGVDSPFLFLLVFPLLASATDLDEGATKIVGTIMAAAFGGMIFFSPDLLSDAPSVIKHALRTALFGVISYYVYAMVRETLRQKYEKEEAKRKFSELIELDRVKSDFLTVAQHRLRTPLSALRWAFENLLADKTIAPPARVLLAEGAKKVAEAADIVNGMLRTAELDAPAGLSLRTEAVSLPALIQSALEDLQFLIARNRVSVSFAREFAATVAADPKFMKAALVNLLDNAVRYSRGGGVEIVLSIGRGSVSVEIRDTGIGIAPDDLPYVGERFYRGRNAIQEEPNESGVGVYLAKRIIERHGGALSVASELGKGTSVTVTLPLAA